ncbi:MAG: competence protein ComJ [Woeseiaceae bacterium]
MYGPLKLYVTYQQVSLFDSSLERPFNSWEDKHVNQGFSWRSSSVSFATLEPDGTIEIEVTANEAAVPTAGVIRAIVVPFRPPETEPLELATITESHRLRAPAGTVGVFFEAGIGGDRSRYRVTFLTGSDALEPQILVADDALAPPTAFLMDAQAG